MHLNPRISPLTLSRLKGSLHCEGDNPISSNHSIVDLAIQKNFVLLDLRSLGCLSYPGRIPITRSGRGKIQDMLGAGLWTAIHMLDSHHDKKFLLTCLRSFGGQYAEAGKQQKEAWGG